MRLAQKGYTVGVIEAGKWWRSEDFAKRNWNIRKYLWMPHIFLYGIQRMNLLRDVFILGAVGVGGGSLIYANTLTGCRKDAKNSLEKITSTLLKNSGPVSSRNRKSSPSNRSPKTALTAMKSHLSAPPDYFRPKPCIAELFFQTACWEPCRY